MKDERFGGVTVPGTGWDSSPVHSIPAAPAPAAAWRVPEVPWPPGRVPRLPPDLPARDAHRVPAGPASGTTRAAHGTPPDGELSPAPGPDATLFPTSERSGRG